MKRLDLLDALGSIDTEFVDEVCDSLGDDLKSVEHCDDISDFEKVGIMDKKTYFKKKLEPIIAVAATVILCVGTLLYITIRNNNAAPVEIEKVTSENSEVHSSMMDEVKQDVPTLDQVIDQIELQEDLNDGIDAVEFGERFPINNKAYGFEDLGEIYATITDARVYRTFSEAGIPPEEAREIIYDPQTDGIGNENGENQFIVTVDFTVENIDATSVEHYLEINNNKYDEYDFRIDMIGGCCSGSIYWTGVDGSLKTEECAEHIFVFHLEPGETVSFSVSYHLDLFWNEFGEDWYGWFSTAATPELGYGIDLHLEDKLPEEWIVETDNDSESQENLTDSVDVVEIGERFPVNNEAYDIGDLGEIYATITDARIYKTFSEAGIPPEDMFADASWMYDSQTDSLGEDEYIVTVDFTVENVDATARLHCYEPFAGEYDEYDFRMDAIGNCCEGYIYWTGIDGSLKTQECGESNCVFHLEPGETVSFSVSYRLSMIMYDADGYGWFYTAATPELGYGIDLHLEDKLPEEWIVETESDTE